MLEINTTSITNQELKDLRTNPADLEAVKNCLYTLIHYLNEQGDLDDCKYNTISDVLQIPISGVLIRNFLKNK